MDRIDLFRVFVRVVEAGSFTNAAATLGMPRSSVSTAVSDLELRVGTRLFSRTTRRVTPTQDGVAFYERCVRLIADVEEAEGIFQGDSAASSGRLHVELPGRTGRLIVGPALPDFLEHYPGIDITLGVTDRAVNVIGEGVDCALRVGPLGESGLVAKHLGQLDIINVASRGYISRYGLPRAVDDLSDHQMVLYASPSNGRVEEFEWVESGAVRSVPVRGRVTVNGAEAYIACCVVGLGIIQIPAYDVRDMLASGELIEVLPDHRAEPMPMHLLYPHRCHLSRRFQLFADWLIALLQKEVLRQGV